MNQRLIAEIGKSQRLQIINKLKRSKGMSVSELAEKLKMSYMGVKQHCVELERNGYVDTWRSPRPVGRPELLYRLTQRAHDLFPRTSNQVTIDLLNAATTLYGPAAAEKLLFLVFQQKSDAYLSRLKGDTLAERAKWLARLRDNEGYMSEFEQDKELKIVEHHSPIFDLLQAFPIVARLEADMFQRLLRVPVQRTENGTSGLYCCTFRVG
jgi:predicted ArsR family transcriptional regulator